MEYFTATELSLLQVVELAIGQSVEIESVSLSFIDPQLDSPIRIREREATDRTNHIESGCRLIKRIKVQSA